MVQNNRSKKKETAGIEFREDNSPNFIVFKSAEITQALCWHDIIKISLGKLTDDVIEIEFRNYFATLKGNKLETLEFFLHSQDVFKITETTQEDGEDSTYVSEIVIFSREELERQKELLETEISDEDYFGEEI